MSGHSLVTRRARQQKAIGIHGKLGNTHLCIVAHFHCCPPFHAYPFASAAPFKPSIPTVYSTDVAFVHRKSPEVRELSSRGYYSARGSRDRRSKAWTRLEDTRTSTSMSGSRANKSVECHLSQSTEEVRVQGWRFSKSRGQHTERALDAGDGEVRRRRNLTTYRSVSHSAPVQRQSQKRELQVWTVLRSRPETSQGCGPRVLT